MGDDVKFNDYHPPEEYYYGGSGGDNFGKKLVDIIVKISGGSISKRRANYVLLGAVAMIFIISFAIFYNSFKSPTESVENPTYFDVGEPDYIKNQ